MNQKLIKQATRRAKEQANQRVGLHAIQFQLPLMSEPDPDPQFDPSAGRGSARVEATMTTLSEPAVASTANTEITTNIRVRTRNGRWITRKQTNKGGNNGHISETPSHLGTPGDWRLSEEEKQIELEAIQSVKDSLRNTGELASNEGTASETIAERSDYRAAA